MKLKKLNDSMYDAFGDDEFEASHNPDGSKKAWPHKPSEPSDEEIEKEITRSKLETKLSIVEDKLKSVKSILRKSSETKKNAITLDRINPLQAKIKNIRQEIKNLK